MNKTKFETKSAFTSDADLCPVCECRAINALFSFEGPVRVYQCVGGHVWHYLPSMNGAGEVGWFEWNKEKEYAR